MQAGFETLAAVSFKLACLAPRRMTVSVSAYLSSLATFEAFVCQEFLTAL